MAKFSSIRAALAAGLACTSLLAGALPAAAADRPAAAGPAAGPATAAAFGDLRPGKVEKGNAALPAVRKKRAGGTHEVPSREGIVKWLQELQIMHTIDPTGRIVLPFRDDATGLNMNVVVITRAKPTGAMWLVQAAIPVGVPLPAGDAGVQKALAFANQWNNENFLIKVSLMQPQGSAPFFLLDASLPCEDGLSRGEFFQNFVGVLVQVAQVFVQRAATAMGA